mmetsp:Transcript_38746/g.75655  ORF Transcript_38746/g.75655 Transcript_38746/m.75655 type:complete len:223 (-) Transcript_38746:370-1038(-)
MVRLDALADVNNVHHLLVPQHVVLREVSVNELAQSEHLPHDAQRLYVRLAKAPRVESRVTQPRRGPPVPSKKLHDEHVRFEQDGFRTGYVRLVNATVVAHLLLGPHLDHFAGVGFAVTMPPSVFALHVFVTITEDENASLVNFDGVFRHAISVVAARGAVVNVSLLAGAQTSVDPFQKPAVEHFEENKPRAGIKTLLGSGAVVATRVVTGRGGPPHGAGRTD